MTTAEWLLYTILGGLGVLYAVYSHQFKFCLADYLPEFLGKRKVLFIIGFAIVLAGLALERIIGAYHGIITLIGGWVMLLGAARWFNQRIVRTCFSPDELRIIRTTIHAGAALILFSTGFFYLPSTFSPATFLMGAAITVLAGRLWWNLDIERDMISKFDRL